MSDMFFNEMGIPQPDFNLNIHSLPHGAMTGRMIEGIENILFNGLEIFQKNTKQISKLSTFYSRTNALRLWKMFSLQKFVNSFDNL